MTPATLLLTTAAATQTATSTEPLVYAGVIVSLVLGVASLVVQARNRRATANRDEAEASVNAVTAATGVVALMQGQLDILRGRVDDLERDLSSARTEASYLRTENLMLLRSVRGLAKIIRIHFPDEMIDVTLYGLDESILDEGWPDSPNHP